MGEAHGPQGRTAGALIPPGAPRPWILTASGVAFDLAAPDPQDVRPFDVAHALSNRSRFGGHALRFYSVAEHSLRVSDEVPARLALAALLHHAAEAYLGDVAGPVRAFAPVLFVTEHRVLEAVGTRFGVALRDLLSGEVREADRRALVRERAALLPPSPRPWPEDQHVRVSPTSLRRREVMGLRPRAARTAFLERLDELTRAGARR